MIVSFGVGLVNRFAAKQLTVFLFAVIFVATIVYGLNYWFWIYEAPKDYQALILLTQNDALFLEGLGLLLLGLLLLLGRGGIDLWSIRAAVLGAAADALYGREGEGQKAPGPSEVLRRDMWKPNGFIRFGLILICSGVILILLYLL